VGTLCFRACIAPGSNLSLLLIRPACATSPLYWLVFSNLVLLSWCKGLAEGSVCLSPQGMRAAVLKPRGFPLSLTKHGFDVALICKLFLLFSPVGARPIMAHVIRRKGERESPGSKEGGNAAGGWEGRQWEGGREAKRGRGRERQGEGEGERQREIACARAPRAQKRGTRSRGRRGRKRLFGSS
jgi:hypothetical protein